MPATPPRERLLPARLLRSPPSATTLHAIRIARRARTRDDHLGRAVAVDVGELERDADPSAQLEAARVPCTSTASLPVAASSPRTCSGAPLAIDELGGTRPRSDCPSKQSRPARALACSPGHSSKSGSPGCADELLALPGRRAARARSPTIDATSARPSPTAVPTGSRGAGTAASPVNGRAPSSSSACRASRSRHLARRHRVELRACRRHRDPPRSARPAARRDRSSRAAPGFHCTATGTGGTGLGARARGLGIERAARACRDEPVQKVVGVCRRRARAATAGGAAHPQSSVLAGDRAALVTSPGFGAVSVGCVPSTNTSGSVVPFVGAVGREQAGRLDRSSPRRRAPAAGTASPAVHRPSRCRRTPAPRSCRPARPGHRPVVVVADPHADRVVGRHADEPRVARVVRRAGLARDRDLELRRRGGPCPR